jgi:hypothetical protein
MSVLYLPPTQTAFESLPPHEQVIQMAGGFITPCAIYVFAELGIADLLKDKPQSADELARTTNTHAPSLYRLLRYLAGAGFLVEGMDRRFSLTPLGGSLQTDAPGHARSVVLTLANAGMWRAFGGLLASIRSGEPVFGRAEGTAPYYEVLNVDPAGAAVFNQAMMGLHHDDPPAVLEAYHFPEIGTLVDIGGGLGNLLTAILAANPALEGVLYDLPHAAAEASRRIAMKGLSKRCKVKVGNFFESVPRGGDVYILSHVLHDWDDGRSLTILQNCRRAMQGRGRLLIVEQVIPVGNDFHQGKLVDLMLLATMQGRVRTEEEHAALLSKAGFRMTRVIPTRSSASIVEAEPHNVPKVPGGSA